jgi:cold shock CspA family protein
MKPFVPGAMLQIGKILGCLISPEAKGGLQHMYQGTVLYYSDTIGYCFIRPDGGGECTFVRCTKVAGGEPENLEQGDRVTYEERPSFERRWE